MPELGDKVSYLVLAAGVPAYSADGQEVGTVKQVLAAPEQDIYDGLLLSTPEGDRYVEAAHASELHERGVVLTLDVSEIGSLPDSAQDS